MLLYLKYHVAICYSYKILLFEAPTNVSTYAKLHNVSGAKIDLKKIFLIARDKF